MVAAALLTVSLLTTATAAVASSSSSSASPRSAGLGLRLVDAPEARRDDPRAQIYIVDHIAPGTTISRRVEAINGTAGLLSPALYAGTAEIRNGTFAPSERGVQGDVAEWTSIEPSRLSLAGGERQTALVTIEVPGDAAPGERYGVIWAELPPVEGGGVAQVNRVGIRVYLSVGPGGEPASDFVVESLQVSRSAEGAPVVTAQVRNTGGRALDMSGTLELGDGPGGLSAGPFPAELGTTLAPGDTAPVVVELDDAIDGGPWNARLVLQSGSLERAAEATITFPAGAGDEAEPVAAEQIPLDATNPWVFAAGALIGLLSLLLLVFALLKRRSRRNKDEDEDEPELQPAAAV
ncbi:MAG: peptidase [Actinomycetes bacterium]